MDDAAAAPVEVLLHGDLGWFCAGADPAGRLVVPLLARRSVKDLLESHGLPHVEVGALQVDGRPTTLGALVRPGTRLDVHPPHAGPPGATVWPTPPEPRRFVLDVHLGTLARRLRAAGFDTWWSNDADDPELAERSVTERRILLTRDRGLLMRRVVVHGHCPRSPDPDEQLDEVVQRWGLAERARPFTRCVSCNGRLLPVDRAAVLDQLPPRTRVEHDTFARCDGCGQVFWPGSHVDALTERHGDLLERE